MELQTLRPEQVLQQVFGFSQFRGLQKKIIDGMCEGRNQFVLMPTGAGKSLCYQIPAMVRSGVAIVVSPLISLMQDQVQALHANGVACAYYNSSCDADTSRKTLAQFHQGELDLLYVSPERLLTESFLARLATVDIALFAIDEAHCVSQWGHDFRPEYVQLGKLRTLFPAVPMIALTATADKQTRQDIVLRLNLADAECHVASFDRPNIRYTVVEKHRPFEQVKKFLQTHAEQSGIIYCATRNAVDDLASKLDQAGFSVLPYHAGLTAEKRRYGQTAFGRDDIQIIVATIAFGMGIDKPNVRFVVHYDIPKHIESYYQETGRAGRDGLPAEALLLFGASGIVTNRLFIDKMTNAEQRRIELHKLNCMIAFAEAQTCRRQVLLNYFSEPSAGKCGNCDVCLDPPATFDGSEAARKALSCVYRVGQRFGVMHVVEVLLGKETERTKRFHHNTLSTYGIGHEHSQQEWLAIFRQLIHRGYLEQDLANYSVLKLTEQARPVLRGEETIILAKPRIQIAKTPKKTVTRRTHAPLENHLFERLRRLRKQMADAQGVPPFIIFNDATLVEMAERRPSTEAELLSINGVGEKKLQAYGREFLHEIQIFFAS